MKDINEIKEQQRKDIEGGTCSSEHSDDNLHNFVKQ